MSYKQRPFTAHIAQTSLTPLLLHIARAEGVYLYTHKGKSYIDMISGMGVNNVGHNHPSVVAAVKAQVDKHLHVMVYGEYIQDTPCKLANQITALLPESLDCVYLVNSGTEANEGAIKLAKRFTGRFEIITCRNSYHGSTHGSLSISGHEARKRPFRPLLPYIKEISFNDENDIHHITSQTACVVMETIQGDAGVRIPSKAYMTAIQQKCRETGTLLILDEVQCGMGRTGTWFAFEQFDIVPDILTVAKAFGGGLPLGAFIANKKIMDKLCYNPPLGHITTFGGNPLSCASAGATLDVIEKEKLLDTVEQKGQLIERLLSHPKVKQIRRFGLMFACDLESPEQVDTVIQYGIQHGVVTFRFLSHPSGLRLSPPLIITESEISQACDVIRRAFDQL